MKDKKGIEIKNGDKLTGFTNFDRVYGYAKLIDNQWRIFIEYHHRLINNIYKWIEVSPYSLMLDYHINGNGECYCYEIIKEYDTSDKNAYECCHSNKYEDSIFYKNLKGK